MQTLQEHALTATRLVVPFTRLGLLGPKHHALVLGADSAGELWVAELSHLGGGYRIRPFADFVADNSRYLRQLRLQPNTGVRTNWEIAQSAIAEATADQKVRYNLIANNCESFVDRHVHGENRISSQVANTVRGLATAASVGFWLWRVSRRGSIR